MKKQLFLAAAFFVAANVSAQSPNPAPGYWVDVTASPYNAHHDCSADAGAPINSAIAAIPPSASGSTSGGVVFFPAGCYLIQTQIVDINTSATGKPAITYLGYGRVELRAPTSSPPSSLMKFGDDNNHTVYRRKIVNLWFNCNDNIMDGIDLDGFALSEFDDVDITYCHSNSSAPWNWHMRTIGLNPNNNNNKYIGGLIQGDAPNSNGINLGANGANVANQWTFVGVKIVGQGSHGSNYGNHGLELDSFTGAFYGGEVSEWTYGIFLAANNASSSPQLGSFVISGNYLENNRTSAIRVGGVGLSGTKAAGFTIQGNYFNCGNYPVPNTGIDLEQASAYTISGNYFNQCNTAAVYGFADGTYQGADNGFVGNNIIGSGQGISLSGSNNTVSASLATKSANYTLAGADSWINVTGNTTVTVPHAMTAQQWNVFNSGTGNVAIACDSGTINGETTISLASNTGKTVTTDGTNCFAH